MPVAIAQGCADVFAMPACREHRLVILHVEVFPLLGFQKLVNVELHRRHLRHDEYVGAQIEDLPGHVPVDPGHKGHHGDHRGDPDHNSQSRQERAQLVRPKRLQGNSNGFGVIHGVRLPASAFRLPEKQPELGPTKFISQHPAWREKAVGSR